MISLSIMLRSSSTFWNMLWSSLGCSPADANCDWKFLSSSAYVMAWLFTVAATFGDTDRLQLKDSRQARTVPAKRAVMGGIRYLECNAAILPALLVTLGLWATAHCRYWGRRRASVPC